MEPGQALFAFLNTVCTICLNISLLSNLNKRKLKEQAEQEGHDVDASYQAAAAPKKARVHEFIANHPDTFFLIDDPEDTADSLTVRVGLHEWVLQELHKWVNEQPNEWVVPQHWAYPLHLESSGTYTESQIRDAIRTHTPYKDAELDETGPLLESTDDNINDVHHDLKRYTGLRDSSEPEVAVYTAPGERILGTAFIPLPIYGPTYKSILGPMMLQEGYKTLVFSCSKETQHEVTLDGCLHQPLVVSILDSLTAAFCEQAHPQMWQYMTTGCIHKVPCRYYHRSPPSETGKTRKHWEVISANGFARHDHHTHGQEA